MIFLVGARRSGTNWLARTLGSHPAVAVVPTETHLFSRGIAPLRDRFQHGASGSMEVARVYMDRDRCLDALRHLCDEVFSGLLETLDPSPERLLERTPEHAAHLDLIGEIYPDARVVHIIRDGRDVVRSLTNQPWGPSSVREAALDWCTTVSRAREQGPALAHYHEVRYERLLADPGQEIGALFRALDLPVDPAVLAGAQAEAHVPFNVDLGDPRVAAGKWRASFSAADLAAFEQEAGGLLAALGYAEEGPGARAGATSRGLERRPAVAVTRAARARAARLWSRRDVIVRRRNRARLGAIAATTSEFLELVAARRWPALAALLHPTALVRVIGPAGRWEGRGEEGRDHLIEVLDGDPALRGRQISGDVHPSVPQFAVVLTYDVGSEIATRVLLLASAGDLINRVVYYQPTAAAAAPSGA